MSDKTDTLLMRDVVRDASLLAEKRNELNTLRMEDNKEWALNKEFYRGNQYVMWSRVSNSVETLGVDETDKPRYKVRLTANAILPGVQQLVSQMTKTRPTIRATPNSGADRDVKAAQMAERLYEYWWAQFGLKAKLTSALVHAQISQGYWLITWDGLAGSSMKVMTDPEQGQPIWDDAFADIYREELRDAAEQVGINPAELLAQFEQTIYMGDIRVQPLSGEQVWLDPAAQTFDDAQFAICKFPMTVDEIHSRYKEKVAPDASTGDRRPTLLNTSSSDERPKNVRDVYFLYHRPNASMPRGRYVVWIEGPNKILQQSDWEFPFDMLPLVKFPGIERPGSVYDEARVTHARSFQKELNSLVSGIAMHKNLTMKPQMLAPIGSLRQRLTDEPGAVFEFSPVAGMMPEWRPIPSLPPYVFEYLNDVQRRLDRVFNIIPSERSQLPARADSGELLELMQEAVSDQIAPEIQRMEDALARAGDIMAAYAQKFYAEPRLLKVKGPGGSVQVSKFLNADLQGGFSFSAEAGSGLPRTRAGQMRQIKDMLEMQLLSPQEAIQYLPIAGLKGVQSRLQADEELAHRRVEKLLRGEPINVPAMEDAIRQVQMDGRNPTTGDFFASPEEAVAFVQTASLTPLPFENLSISQYVIGQHMKGTEFEKYPPELQARFLEHYSLLQQAQGQESAPAEAVKTTLSLKGTVGPTVAADILQRSGVQAATPETMAEQPLETSVYDSVDKADADEAGNDPLSDIEKQMLIMQKQAQHELTQAKTVHQMSQAEELHQQKLKNMQAQADRPPSDGG